MMNKNFKLHLTALENNDVELEIRHWYQSNENTHLNKLLTRFDMINKTFNKLCVPLHACIHWSVLDVVILPDTGCMNGYVK